MKVAIDKDKCIGCGACASIEPSVFRVSSKDNKAEANSKGCTEEELDNCKEAASVCPTGAISVVE